MFVSISGGNASKAEERLLRDLFTNYTADARPALNDNDTVNVTIGMTLNQIIDVVSVILFFMNCISL